jgi:hypothetical protein
MKCFEAALFGLDSETRARLLEPAAARLNISEFAAGRSGLALSVSIELAAERTRRS